MAVSRILWRPLLENLRNANETRNLIIIELFCYWICVLDDNQGQWTHNMLGKTIESLFGRGLSDSEYVTLNVY
jgi:hypothetical protein